MRLLPLSNYSGNLSSFSWKSRETSEEEALSTAHDAENYGSKGQKWHPSFVRYMASIVSHATYSGMPDAKKKDGKIQWEAPSNRKSGLYQHTHHKRREWWKAKARSIGIKPDSPNWISDTAKRIHPTGEKPCKRCGKIAKIAYAYPNGQLQRRLARLFPGMKCGLLETLSDFLKRLVDHEGTASLLHLPTILRTNDIVPPNLGNDLKAWLEWIESEYVPREPSLLSPGVMSNAPDRLDGFHSFNRCCRGTADTGRHVENLRLYSTDRRVFEFWSDGDWIAANRLMGIVNAKFRAHACADGGSGTATADHIGPLSLGFLHRPEFRLLTKAANSAKNNRMTLQDVQHLIHVEAGGEVVMSWYGSSLWNRRKGSVQDKETALRLSKLLRDNQRNAMRLLGVILEQGHHAFLTTLLNLQFAERDVEFDALRIDDRFVTVFDGLRLIPRTTKYVHEQKARRMRIAFEALEEYGKKENRHAARIYDARVDEKVALAIRALERAGKPVLDLNSKLKKLLAAGEAAEAALRDVSQRLPRPGLEPFDAAREALREGMEVISERLDAMWDSDRYVRAPFDFDAI